MSNERAAKIAKLLRERVGARGRSIPARIVDMASFWTRGTLMADLGTSVVTVIARTLDCLRVGDWIFIRKLEHTRWSDYVYDGFDQRLLPDGSIDYNPGYCPPVPGVRVVIVWSGSVDMIPAGWVLCDGRTHGDVTTRDLRDRFVMGTAGSYGGTGGELFVDISHDHGTNIWFSDPDDAAHRHTVHGMNGDTDVGSFPGIGPIFTSGGGVHGHPDGTGTVTDAFSHDHIGLGTTDSVTTRVDLRPPYYALCYIKSLFPVAPPVGVIFIYDEADVNPLPAEGYQVFQRETVPNLTNIPVGAGGTYANGDVIGGGLTDFAAHDHTSGYSLAGGEHEHDYALGTVHTPPYLVTSQLGIGDTGIIVGPDHDHPMAMGTDSSGAHPHGLSGLVVQESEDTSFALDPPYICLWYVRRVA